MQCQRLLYTIVLTLVFEGLVRKLVPSALGLLIFSLKDLLCLYATYLLTKIYLPPVAQWLHIRWQLLVLLLLPLLVYTAFLDLPLSVFAAKQYLLYVAAALLVPVAYAAHQSAGFKRFALHFAFLLIPTTLVAMLQNALPATHWLNLSVGGDSLDGFSAAGFLRVSSTFSFTGQYSWFLNAVCAFMICGFLLPSADRGTSFSNVVQPLGLGVLLTIGMFITGGRSAVLSNFGCLLIGFALSSWKSPSTTLRRGLLAGLFLIPAFTLLHDLKPEFFAAYEARSAGTKDQSHEEEIQNRLLGAYTDWTEWYGEQPMLYMLIGNGLGVMSNGSDRVSSYANSIRSTGLWTEGDMPSTAWEGGLYLILVWYGFRLAVILYCFRLWRAMKNQLYSTVSSFLLANVLLNGVLGNIGMQPPMAIWWWLSVGAILAISGFEKATRPQAIGRPAPPRPAASALPTLA